MNRYAIDFVFSAVGFGQLNMQVGHGVEDTEYQQGGYERDGELEKGRHWMLVWEFPGLEIRESYQKSPWLSRVWA